MCEGISRVSTDWPRQAGAHPQQSRIEEWGRVVAAVMIKLYIDDRGDNSYWKS